MDASRATALRAYEPFLELCSPYRYVTCVFGDIEGAQVEAFEYEYTSSDQDGQTTLHDQLVVAVQHPTIRGTASFRDDAKQWDGVAAFIDAVMWVPPFTVVKAFQLFMENKNPDRRVGDADFDRLYVVHAASDEAARSAIPAGLREAVLHVGYRGVVELRPGVLLYAPRAAGLDGERAVGALGFASLFLGAMARRPAHPMR
jgi:hypothetical protein